MFRAIEWLLGLTSANSVSYLFWSGFAGDLFIFGGIIALYRKHNCHVQHCYRIGKHVYDGTPYCTKHHPTGK